MNIDNEYSKQFFDVWIDGLTLMKERTDNGMIINEGKEYGMF